MYAVAVASEEVGGIGAVVAVDPHAGAGGVGKDSVAIDGVAALRQLVVDAGELAVNEDHILIRRGELLQLRLPLIVLCRDLWPTLLGTLGALLEECLVVVEHLIDLVAPVRHSEEEVALALVAVPLHEAGKFALVPLQLPVTDLSLQILPRECHPLLVLIAEVAADLALRPRGLGDVQPVRLGSLAVGGDDADGVAILQHIAQPHIAPIDAGGDAVAADIGVDGEGEVEHRGALGQLQHLPLGGKDVHLLIVEIHPEVLDHLVLGQLIPHLEDPARLRHQVIQPGLTLDPLVPPVRRQSPLGDLIHPLGPYLHLHPAVVGPHHGDVKALVAVALRD